MRIGFDAKRAFYNYAGLGNYSRNIISQLVRYFPDNEYILYSPGKKFFNDSFPPADIQTISPKKFLHKKLPSYWRSFHLSQQINKDQINVYHGLSNELPSKINQFKGKSVVSIHDLIFIHYPELYKKIDRNIYHKKFSYAAEKADRVIAISQQTKTDLINLFNTREEKIEVVYQSCNPAFSIQKTDIELHEIRNTYNLPKEFILYVGTIEKRKNLLKLVQALHKGNISIPLVAVGKETEYTKLVHQYIAKNNLKNIQFFSFVPNSDLPGLYQLANLFIYPSSYEGFGIPILEALNSGVPVIAGKGSCLEETGGPNSLYINPYDLEAFSHAIKTALEDNDLRKKMIGKGKEFALNFTENKTSQNLFRVYESLL
jgi:glycosyltransferase involved in cell wall biosynthesis